VTKCAVLLTLGLSSTALAHGFPDPTDLFPRFSVGGGGGLALRGDVEGIHTSVEATYSPLFAFHFTLGLDYAHCGGDAAYGYAEAAANLIFTIGAGVGYRGGDDLGQGGSAYHVFAGLPIPTEFPFSRNVVYIEPFYRGVFVGGNAGRIDEAGLLIKWSLDLRRRN
jgi:hypothetical protein